MILNRYKAQIMKKLHALFLRSRVSAIFLRMDTHEVCPFNLRWVTAKPDYLNQTP